LVLSGPSHDYGAMQRGGSHGRAAQGLIPMEYDFKDDRLYLQRTSEEKEPLLQRLNRVEGQVRGLRQMIENDRYCGDEVQQASAITAAVREVALLMISQHLEAGVGFAAQNGGRKAAVDEMIGLLRIAMRQQ
jgi:CsoR family transcriptional regulator, copper-sensing transcriptional repressor